MNSLRRFVWQGSVVAVGVAVLAVIWLRSVPEEVEPRVEPLPPLAQSRFLNAHQATYVGQAACIECHTDQHHSWEQTAHSRALAEVAITDSPPPGRFEHTPSGRSYEIYFDDGVMRHRETARSSSGEPLLLADLPVRYVIGSGRFSHSYLVERDGFLTESPATWYAALGAWGISPGYETHNAGFERPVNRECIGCHVGRAEHDAGAIQRFTIHSPAIDCERCHGPGSLHVARWRDPAAEPLDSVSGADPTIVHPARLSRAESEAVCAQCHLHTPATVELRGRRRTDFRPGLPLEDFCIHYAPESPNREMRVVGHVEQMRLSACYQRTTTLTCTTCHDPHHSPPDDQRLSYFRDRCLSCHGEQSCRIPSASRAEQAPGDNCMTCHMPSSKTDIPHFAFTHHRIGLHEPDRTADAPQTAAALVPLDDVSRLPQIERDRCLGLGYLQLAGTADSADSAGAWQTVARDLLEDVRARGLIDPEVDAALARLFWRVDPAKTRALAESILTHADATPESRVTALFTLATTRLDQRDASGALPLLEELVTRRLSSEDWYLLSTSRRALGDIAGAVAAAERAAELAPQFPQLHDHLASLYEQVQQPAEAQRARLRADALRRSSLAAPP